jgi:DNA-binding XRE family transcriptional regulator
VPEKPNEGSSQQGLAKARRVQAMHRGLPGSTPQRGLGKAIRLLRDESKMTQKGLAEKSGISTSWISMIERGEVDPTWATVQRIATVLGVSLETIAKIAEDIEESNG